MTRVWVGLLVCLAIGAQGGEVSFVRLSLGGEGESGIFSEDLDGDGRRDIIALGLGHISVFRADPNEESGYASTPEALVTGSQAYYADVADVLPAKGKELLILTPSGVGCFAHKDGRYASQPIPLLECKTILAMPAVSGSVLAQTASSVPVLPWNFAFDADGDGRDDVLVYHEAGVDVYLQKAPGQFAKPVSLRLVPYVTHFGPAGHKAEELRGHEARPVRLQFTLRPLESRDVNGDGRRDLASGTLWFAQKVDGGFDPVPAEMPRDLQAPLAPNVRSLDIDGDGRKDRLVEEVDVKDLFNIFTYVRVFLASGDGVIPAEPTQTVGGQNILIHTNLPVHDFNHDGALDFAMFRTGITPVDVGNWFRLNMGKIDGTLNVFLFDREQRAYPRRASYTKPISMRFRIDLMESMMGLIWERYLGTMMRFEGDYNGDGLLDLLVREETETIALYFNTGDSRDLYPRRPSIVLPELPPFGGLALSDLNGDGAADIIFYPATYDAIVAAYVSRLR